MKFRIFILAAIALLLSKVTQAQTDNDAIMMNKHQWCNGFSYDHVQWKNYWEGTLKRDNPNIGTFTSQSVMFMTNYGITHNLDIMAGLPYVGNHVSGGTLHKMNGLQDASFAVKWRPYHIQWGNSKLSFYAVGSIITPVNNYDVDFMPLAIGIHSTNVTGRALADYQKGKFFVTVAASYTSRSNTNIDEDAYYTDHIIYSNIVDLANTNNLMLNAGLRSKYVIAEAMVSRITTLGGTDIRRNDMPHPWNRMNTTSVGARIKYTPVFFQPLLIVGEADHVVAGRNVGQATSVSVGVYYRFTFKNKTTEPVLHS